MSLAEMKQALRVAELGENEVMGWPKLLERYAQWTRQERCDRIEIRSESLIQLLRSLRDSGKNAYASLEVVGASDAPDNVRRVHVASSR